MSRRHPRQSTKYQQKMATREANRPKLLVHQAAKQVARQLGREAKRSVLSRIKRDLMFVLESNKITTESIQHASLEVTRAYLRVVAPAGDGDECRSVSTTTS